jgi:hypothetical protein
MNSMTGQKRREIESDLRDLTAEFEYTKRAFLEELQRAEDRGWDDPVTEKRLLRRSSELRQTIASLKSMLNKDQ